MRHRHGLNLFLSEPKLISSLETVFFLASLTLKPVCSVCAAHCATVLVRVPILGLVALSLCDADVQGSWSSTWLCVHLQLCVCI